MTNAHSLGVFAVLTAILPVAGAQAPVSKASPPDRLAKILSGGVPETKADLIAMEHHTKLLIAKVLPCLVSIGGASGVLIHDKLILSAAHVTRTANRSLSVTLNDGRRVRAVTLGANHRNDTGLLRITSPGAFPYAEMGHSSTMQPGDWCLMLGYPGGRKAGRMAPARLGRVMALPSRRRPFLVTDCTMSSGDSGGPLFDMQGRVIGINSRIAMDLATNMHVPIDTFRLDWDSLIKGEVIGSMRERTSRRRRGAEFGAKLDPDPKAIDARIVEVERESPAAKAGLKVGDVILEYNGREASRNTVRYRLRRARAGDKVKLKVKRGSDVLELEVQFGRNRRQR